MKIVKRLPSKITSVLRLKKFDQYIIKNFLGTYAFAILLLMVIVIIFDANEKLDAVLTAPLYDTVFKYFLNFLPFIISQFSPLFTFIAVIFFTSRLADRSEIIAILSSGITFRRLTVPYLACAALIAALSYVLSAYVIPPANIERLEYQNKWVNDHSVTAGNNIQLQVRPGVIAYITRYDNVSRNGYRMSLDEFDGNTLVSRLTAENIRYDTLGRWHLKHYTIRDFSGVQEKLTTGNSIDTLLNIDPRDFLISAHDEETMTTPQLRDYIKRQKARGVANIQNFEIEYERRFAMTAAAFILTIIGLSLSSRKVRGGMGMNIGIGLLLSFSYILFMTVTSSFAVSGLTPAWVAMWIPNVIYTFIAIVLYRRASR
ncbi:MAG: LptF/LptG family permease [Muribaculaceae bacterium]|nr:LptF/LptG family permease [Muribaculaceae bacterium]